MLADMDGALDPCISAKNEDSVECRCDSQFLSVSVCHMSVCQQLIHICLLIYI